MPYRIKSRICDLNKNLQDLLPILTERLGTPVYPGELSVALKNPISPKHQKILATSNEIVTEWENEKEAPQCR